MGEYADIEIDNGMADWGYYGGSTRLRVYPARKKKKPSIHPVGHEPKAWSRYGYEEEEKILKGWVATLKPETKRWITQVWCDSKACAYYVIEVAYPIGNANELAETLHEHILSVSEGYNAIIVNDKDFNVYAEWNAWW